MSLFISIIIPCRNEENFISKCLDSILANEYPKDRIEILVSDGMSEDGTREIIRRYSEKYFFVKLLDNHQKVTPIAMNIGIKHSIGEIIVIVSAHSILDKEFLKHSVEYLETTEADAVGGVLIALPGNNSILAQSIAVAISHPFGVGNAYFRIGSKEPKYVDTVPFGCYRKEVFSRVGFFDEELIRNQDDEFNFRLIKNGGKILLIPDIISYYSVRDSLSKLWNMYFQYGYFKPLVVKKVGGVCTWRQLVPLAFISSLIISGICSIFFRLCGMSFVAIALFYIIVNSMFSFSICIKKGIKHFISLFISFATLHFAYGLGYLKGIWNFIILKKSQRRAIKDVPLTR
ncbi:MAG: glycosyltransferase family 2 protein [bacterium]|nr:glycosyltransferase family 2 protein [bacterium]